MIRVYALLSTLQSFVTDRFENNKDRGATAVEYGLLVGLIAVVIIAAVVALGSTLDGLFTEVDTSIKNKGETGL